MRGFINIFRKTVLAIALLFSCINLFPQSFSDLTFLITDLSEGWLSEQSLKNELSVQYSGLYLKLEYNQDEDELLTVSEAGGLSFRQFSETLTDFLTRDKERLLPLFIDYSGSIRILKDAIAENGLSEYIYYLPPGERWPSEENIKQTGKNLIVFLFQKPTSGNYYFHYVWDYIAEYPHSGSEDPLFDGYYINGDISKELLLIRDFDVTVPVSNQSKLRLDLNQNQYYINHLLNRWSNTGKQPNFIFAGKNTRFLSPLIPWLYTYKRAKGIVRFNDKPMHKVFWKHSNKCITNGYFSFPYSEGEELNLTPFSPGYRFDPKTSVVSAENHVLSAVFSAYPLPMEEGLKAYFPFDNNWENFMDEYDLGKKVNASITSDVKKGEVAKLPENSFITIGKPEDYGIRNNSFSVSTWFKTNELGNREDYSILGTPEDVFRKGLHLVIRRGRPYFGFYGNDLLADRLINPNEWYHIVFRYNYFNGEQAIFVNGQNVGASYNHASFIGDSALIIGRSIINGNFLNGYIDDLYIWNRPLGEEEILYLYNNDYIPEKGHKNAQFPFLWFSLLFILIIAFIVLHFIRIKEKRKGNKHQPGFKEEIIKKQNSLFLFGDFQVFDNHGHELSSAFTPKLLELFLLVVLYTIKNNKGIKTEKLTSVLWPGFTLQKAANNRSVTINKLRKIIHDVKGLEFEFNKGYWRVIFEKSFFCDYYEAVKLLKENNSPSKQTIERFYGLVKQGAFLNELDWDWLDEYRGFIVNEIIDRLLLFATKLDEEEDSLLLKAIAERILIIDDTNEKAMQIVIKQLLLSNNINQARFRFTQFITAFKKAYGESYKLTFDEYKDYKF